MAIAVVTGGSSGIGYELARRFSQDGYDLVLVARDKERLEKAAKEFVRNGSVVKTVACDLTDPSCWNKVYAAAEGARAGGCPRQ